MKQRKHMDLDGCLSTIFPYHLPMFLIFLASSLCWKRYFFQQPQKKRHRAACRFSAVIEVIYVLKEGSCCEQGTHQELMEKLLGTTSRKVRFCSRELREYVVDMCLISLSHRYVYFSMFPKIVAVPPKSSILIGFSIINYPFWGTPIFGNTHLFTYVYIYIYTHTWIPQESDFFLPLETTKNRPG